MKARNNMIFQDMTLSTFKELNSKEQNKFFYVLMDKKNKTTEEIYLLRDLAKFRTSHLEITSLTKKSEA
jgi:hypothetical protein